MRYLPVLSLAACLSLSTSVKAQGDSDPGFSTIGAMRPNADLSIGDEFENDHHSFSIGHGMATGERDVKLNMPQFEGNIAVEDLGYVSIKASLKATNGELAKQLGFGDVYVAFTHRMANENYPDWSYQFTGGVMFGMGTADVTDGGGRALPMAYQSNLGSTDVILGASMKWKQYVTVSAGYQQPVFRYNNNGYARSVANNELSYSSAEYPVSRKLYRNGDLMLRIEGSYSGRRAGFSAGPLLIYHLRNDLYQDKNNNDAWTAIEGSQGMTMNVTGNVFLRFGRYGQFKLDVTGAVPVTTRTLAPEGLVREWLMIPRLTFFFHQNTLLYERF